MFIIRIMKLSEGVEWALHCCTVLALVPEDRALPAARLAEFHGVPTAYLAKHLQALSRAGVIESVPGQRGGYRLAPGPGGDAGPGVPGRLHHHPGHAPGRGGLAGRAAIPHGGRPARRAGRHHSPEGRRKGDQMVSGGVAMRIFVAGATGVVGQRAVPLLVEAGHEVTAVARTPEKAAWLRSVGATPVSVDLFDAAAVTEAMAGHDVVINLATSIPPASRAARRSAWAGNDRIRTVASANLAGAAIATGAGRYIQESISLI